MKKRLLFIMCLLLVTAAACGEHGETSVVFKEAEHVRQQALIEQLRQLIDELRVIEAAELLQEIGPGASERQRAEISGLRDELEALCYKNCFFLRFENVSSMECICIEESDELIVYSFGSIEEMQSAGREYDAYLASNFHALDDIEGAYQDSLGHGIRATWSVQEKNIYIEVICG